MELHLRTNIMLLQPKMFKKFLCDRFETTGDIRFSSNDSFSKANWSKILYCSTFVPLVLKSTYMVVKPKFNHNAFRIEFIQNLLVSWAYCGRAGASGGSFKSEKINRASRKVYDTHKIMR